MRQEDLKRLSLIKRVIDKVINQVEAGALLKLSTRQIRRITDRVLKEGDNGVIHRSRGKPSCRAYPGRVKERVMKLCRTKYEGFNPTLASEKLFEISKIKISRETLRSWFKQNRIEYKTRKKRPHRNWRERKPYFGQMEQIDGSHHDWFEGRGPKCVLIGYIDDANNNVFVRFYNNEGTISFMDSFKRYTKGYGLPQSVYIDRHAAYKAKRSASIEEQLNNKDPQSQVQRALEELKVEVVYARSAQAKGRIERLFKTLQDRLIKEMRLEGVKSVDEGNKFLKKYLPIYNKRFKVEPLKKENLHRLLAKDTDLDDILCIKTERGLNNDSTVLHNKKLYHILDKVCAKRVVVEEHINGSIRISLKGKTLKYRQIYQRPIKRATKKAYLFKIKKVWRPPMDHPLKAPLFKRRCSLTKT